MERLQDKVPWYVGASLFAAASVIALVVAVMSIAGLAWDDTWPWLMLGAGVMLALAALVVLSYAPPGPNWIERALEVEVEPVMIIIGVTSAVIGTVFWFDFSRDDGGAPSPWWILPIAIGLVLVLLAVLRLVASEDEEPHLLALRTLRARADRLWVEVQADRDQLSQLVDAQALADVPGQLILVRQALDDATGFHAEAEDLFVRLGELVRMSQTSVDEAELRREMVAGRLAKAKNSAGIR